MIAGMQKYQESTVRKRTKRFVEELVWKDFYFRSNFFHPIMMIKQVFEVSRKYQRRILVDTCCGPRH